MTPPVPSVMQGHIGSPVFRYLMAALLMGFAMFWATLLIWQKELPTIADAAVILTPLVLGFAAAAPGTFSTVIAAVKPLLPTFGRHDG